MKVIFRKLSGRFILGTLWVILASSIAPSAARASCGDYVSIGHPAAPMSAHAQPMSAPLAHPERSTPEPQQPKPCSGPTCSSKPVSVPLVPTPPPVRHLEEWGTTETVASPSPLPTLARWEETSPIHP